MNITIVAIGKVRTEHFEPAISEYQKRLGRWTQATWRILASSDQASESQQLLKLVDGLGPQTVTILLDERGEQWSTSELASRIGDWQNGAVKNVVFIIGGAHGVTDTLRNRVDCIWSLSALVFPHEFVRVLLIEQLYRAFDIIAGGKYHHV